MRRGQRRLARELAHKRQKVLSPAYGGRHTARRSHKVADSSWRMFISAHVHISACSYQRMFIKT